MSFESQTPVVDNQQNLSKTRVATLGLGVAVSAATKRSIGLWRLLTPVMNRPHPQRLRTTPRPVETIAITQGEAVRRITLLGQIEASETATVRRRMA